MGPGLKSSSLLSLLLLKKQKRGCNCCLGGGGDGDDDDRLDHRIALISSFACMLHSASHVTG